MKFQYVLFDLDGTLTESAPGITRCVQYALRSFGIEEPDLHKLESFVGPPLNEELMRRYHLSEEQASLGVAKYRERYGKKGIFECELYPGIRELLRHCHEAGLCLAVASSKPEVYVRQILGNFNIAEYFDVVCGPGLEDEKHRETGADNKARIVRTALEGLAGAGGLTPEFRQCCAMVGDRRFDILGARRNGVTGIGVLYGYGSRQELEDAGADEIAETVPELEMRLLV